MDIDKLKFLLIKFVMALYIGYIIVYLVQMRHKSNHKGFIVVSICVAVIIGFILLIVLGYKKSMEKLSRRIREMPGNKVYTEP